MARPLLPTGGRRGGGGFTLNALGFSEETWQVSRSGLWLALAYARPARSIGTLWLDGERVGVDVLVAVADVVRAEDRWGNRSVGSTLATVIRPENTGRVPVDRP